MTMLPEDAMESKTADSASFSVEHIRILQRLQVPPHAHSGRHLLIVLDGMLIDQGAEGRTELTSGHALCSPGSEWHQPQIVEVPFSCLVITIDENASALFPRSRQLIEVQSLLPSARDVSHSVASRSPHGALSLGSSTASLLAQTHHLARGRDVPTPPEWLLEACAKLKERFCEPIRFDALAREIGVHPAHLSRAFRSHLGRTPREFVHALRVTAALNAIEGTPSSLSAIAADCGFADQAHLTRVTRAYVGETPSAVRKAAQCKVRSSQAC